MVFFLLFDNQSFDMKRILYRVLVVVLALPINSCAQNNDKENVVLFNEDQLLKHLEVLSSDKYEGRETGKKGNDSARAYIIEQFKALNVEPFNDSYEQSFTFKKSNKTYKAVNALGVIKGSEYPDQYIVLSAHYDHLGIKDNKIYNGADDDASGVSALFSIAEYLKENSPKYSIVFAAFDAEEMGLEGAKYFVKTIDKKKVLVNLNMDMISRSSKNELYVVGGRYNKELKRIINEFKNPTSTKLLQGHDGTDGKQNWTMSSDHGPFHKAGIPFLYFGNEDHAAYHQPTDDFKDITPQFYINSVKIISFILKSIDNDGL